MYSVKSHMTRFGFAMLNVLFVTDNVMSYNDVLFFILAILCAHRVEQAEAKIPFR